MEEALGGRTPERKEETGLEENAQASFNRMCK